MRIPPKYQIFDSFTPVTFEDQTRLGPHLSNWNKLNEILLLGVSEADLRKLAILEMMGKKRRIILRRLLGPITRHTRISLETKIENALK